MEKNNEKAASIRQQGNALYRLQEFKAALIKYNESICWAEADSEDLAIGYANRSAVYLEWEEYEFALANIALAKSHNYPQRMMPKLVARERICRRQHMIRKLSCPELRRSEFRLELNVEVNPRIPFLAKDIHVEEIVGVGWRVVADRDFTAGDVILQNRNLLGSVDPSQRYAMCDFCTRKFFHSLIPCPNCVSVMFCGEDCRQRSWKYCHRYECGITSQLHDVFEDTKTAYLGPRLFFYGLSLFGDDVAKMQQFCETHPRTGSDPFSVDYVNLDPLEEFKVIHTYKTEAPDVANRATLAADQYFEAYQASALVKSLFDSTAKKKFMRHYFADYIQAFPMKACVQKFMYSALPMVFTACSTAANVILLNVGDQTTIVVFRPISRGSRLMMKVLEVCDMSFWRTMPQFVMGSIMAGNPEFPMFEWMTLEGLVGDDIDDTSRLILLQGFLWKHSHVTCLWDSKQIMLKYHALLEKIYERQVMNDMRASVVL